MSAIDPRHFRDTLGRFCTGVVVVTGIWRDTPVGFSAQSFLSLSLEPPLVAICPARTSSTWPRLREAGSFCINVLADRQRSLCETFARSGQDRFSGVAWRPATSGAPVLDGVLAWIDCDLELEHDGGDHTIAVGRVRDLEARDAEGLPLLFFRGRYGSFDAEH
ncbi:MAG: flavin reductase family protein [Pseudomonadales bacterium]|jgi:flavin reductase (DIM6/NTAB) family NADH-FMN oxidoreductase RutF|nr:flavin reductase family protein [Pseudomonadales bacterium]